ncbi:MAG: cytochrome-c peroxidase [Deltaproteobacteria bacterium]
MKRRIIFRGALISLIFAFLISSAGILKAQDGVLTPKEELGKSIFFDVNLSINQNESCAACHGPAAGWTGPESNINAHGAVYEGSIPGRFGNRKPPSAAYATLSPIFHLSRLGTILFLLKRCGVRKLATLLGLVTLRSFVLLKAQLFHCPRQTGSSRIWLTATSASQLPPMRTHPW